MARVLAQMGLRPDGDVPLPDSAARTPWHLWPDNLPTWRLWSGLQTQWRRGFDGAATGLDYGAVWAVLDGLRVRRRAEVFEHLQAMERAALEVVRRRSTG